MKCPNCKKKIKKEDAFCQECGTKISIEDKRKHHQASSIHKKYIYIGAAVVLLLAITAFAILFFGHKSSDKNVVCNSPYIRHELGCCLDKNSNSICDNDESTNTVNTDNGLKSNNQNNKTINTSSQVKITNPTGSELSVTELKNKISTYLGKAVQGQTVTIDSAVNEVDVYYLKLTVDGKNYNSFARKDGSLLFASGIDLTQNPSTADATTQTINPVGTILSESVIKTKVSNYLNNLLNKTATITGFEDQGDLYALKIYTDGTTYDSYVRKDGSFLFPTALDMNQPINVTQNNPPAQTNNVPKTNKPVVELFVMSYCPYGDQAEKGILPAVRTLGDNIDFKIRFVYYAMHGKKEVDENLRQYCIQAQQSDKYLNYLACFLNAGDSPGCVLKANVDQTKLDTCVSASDTQFSVTKNFNDQTSWLNGNFPKFDIDLALNTKYSVGGSPTLIINGLESNAGRDSASYLKAICNTFNTPPSECSTQLSTVSPGPGLGYDSTSAATAAGCSVN